MAHNLLFNYGMHPSFTLKALTRVLTPLLVYFLVSCFPVFAAQGASRSCRSLFSYEISESPIKITEISEHIFRLQQASRNEKKPFIFNVRYVPQKKKGYVELYLYLMEASDNLRSQIFGKEAYDQMMEHFSSLPITYIKGIWYDGVNLNEYFHNRKVLKMTKEEAALNTWSGRQAQRYGYKHAVIFFNDYLGEAPDSQFQVNVRFYKEPRTRIQSFIDAFSSY